MQRYPDWVTRLQHFLLSNRERPFHYGQWDCCLFVADAIEVMTGVDLAASFRQTYHSRKEARTRHGSVRAICEQVFAECESVPVLLAQRGDIILVKRSRDHSLGILNLSGRDILAIAQQGFYRLSLGRGVCAWHI